MINGSRLAVAICPPHALLYVIRLVTVFIGTVPESLRLCRDLADHDTGEGSVFSEPCAKDAVLIDDVPLKKMIRSVV